MNETSIVKRLSAIGIGGNILLVAFKLYAGIAGGSGAMVSDAVHSLSDVFATLIAYIGVRSAGKAPDREHPYGHDRFECLASLSLGMILLGTGLGIGAQGLTSLLSPEKSLATPGGIALLAAIISILTKEAMFRYTRYYAEKMSSSAFMADAWHHRADALSSVGALAGIGGAMLGLPILDPLASVVICLFILKVGLDIVKDALDKLTDHSCGEAVETEIRCFIAAQPGVLAVDLLRTRCFGSRIYIDAEISADGDLSLWEAHAIAHRVHDAVEAHFPDTKHIMIHVNPAKAENLS